MDKVKTQNRQKRGGSQLTLVLDELAEILPSHDTVEQQVDVHELTEIITKWIRELSPEVQRVFVLRYFMSESIQSIARKSDMSESAVSYATPITAGALAYFLKSNSMVVWRPEIGKAAVCSGSRIATTNSSPNSTSASQIAMDRTVGVGMLNIYPAVNALYNWDMSGGDNFNFGFHLANTSLNFSHTINVTNADIAASKRMNVCYCYNVRNTYASGISHNTNAPAIGTVYPIIMTVTSPNGTVYTSNYAYTNMEVVSFIPAVAGTYTVNVYFADSSETFEGETHFGFMANVISQSSSI